MATMNELEQQYYAKMLDLGSPLPSILQMKRAFFMGVLSGEITFGGDIDPGDLTTAIEDYFTDNPIEGDFAAADHDHDGVYATASHTHDYAASDHNHDSDYAASSHTHEISGVNGLGDALGGKADASDIIILGVLDHDETPPSPGVWLVRPEP